MPQSPNHAQPAEPAGSEGDEPPVDLDPAPDVTGLLRAARHAADLSQRELARRVGVSPSTVGGVESGARGIEVRSWARWLAACGWSVVVVDGSGLPVRPDDDPARDRGGRRYPAHLDVRPTGGWGDWWGDMYAGAWGVPARPSHTFCLSRDKRDFWRGMAAYQLARRTAEPPLLSDAVPEPSGSRISELLDAFDTQLRRTSTDGGPGVVVELLTEPGAVLRVTPPPGSGWGGGVFWSDLDEGDADATIAAVQAWFGPLGRDIEWKHYGYDRPADLPERLRAAGFIPEGEEALVIGEVAEVRARLASAREPTGVAIRPMRSDADGRRADWAAIDALKSAVWDTDTSAQTQALVAEHEADPNAMSVWLAQAADGTVVSAGWVRFHAGTDFASLWGGSTLAAWRGRGIYTALVARRAEEAAARGVRYLQVDASPDSRPILERLGLRHVTSTTPWVWRP